MLFVFGIFGGKMFGGFVDPIDDHHESVAVFLDYVSIMTI
jgi:hypothetical protein